METDNRLQKKQMDIMVILLIATIILLFSFFIFRSKKDNKKQIALTDEWTVRINDELYSNVSFDDFFFKPLGKGDQITLTTKLMDYAIPKAEIMILTCHSTIKVYIDHQEIYQYGLKRMEEGRMLGYGNHIIDLPENYTDKELEIVMIVTEKNAFSSIASPIIADSASMVTNFISSHRLELFIGIFLIMFGLVFIFVTLLMIGFEVHFLRLLMVALLSVCIGAWTLGSSHLLQFMIPKLSYCTIIEFISLYMAPIPILLYFVDDVKALHYKISKIIYWIILAVNWIFVFTAFLLQLLDNVHLPASLISFHIIAFCSIAYILILIYSRFRDRQLSNRLQIVGMTIVIGVVVIDLIRFNLQKYFKLFSRPGFQALLPFAFLIFVTIMFITFCVNMRENIYIKAKQDILIQQAYIDPLTMIPNRRFCEEMMKQMEEEPNKDVIGIMSIDLNGLKAVNDLMGHDVGDDLIKSAAQILYDTFHQVGTIGRMGGDEFIVICKKISLEQISRKLIEMQKKINRCNAQESRFQVTLSYGYAIGYELDIKDIKKIYILADNRMYEYKKKFKQNR